MKSTKTTAPSIFETTEKMQLDDPILSLSVAFRQDPRPLKVNLGVGAFYPSNGKPIMLHSVKEAEKRLLAEEEHKEYLPIEGDRNFIQHALILLFGQHSSILFQNQATACQTIGGTSALRVGSDYLAIEKPQTVYISDPTWPNHRNIFVASGHEIKTYPYLKNDASGIDFEGLLKSVDKMRSGDVILLQASCHNPTGMDLSNEQWIRLSQALLKKGVFPFFDMAYQGFGDGLTEDAFAIRQFAEDGHSFFAACSFSKNFGLYGERVGMLVAVTHESSLSTKVIKQLKSVIRANYSSSPRHGAAVVAKILGDEGLKKLWQEELDAMRARIKEMRHELFERMKQKGLIDDKRSHFISQKGLFSYGIIPPEKVEELKTEYGVYMLNNGRINVAGLNLANLEHVVDVFSKIMH